MLMFDPDARVALLSADRAYVPGAEVFDSHGPGLSWSDLVMDHGCVVEGQADNPRCVVVDGDRGGGEGEGQSMR
jgi:hypothetical protein